MHDLKAAVIHLVDRHGHRLGIQRLAGGLCGGGNVARAARDQVHQKIAAAGLFGQNAQRGLQHHFSSTSVK